MASETARTGIALRLLVILAALLTGCGATGPLPTLPERKLKEGSDKIDRSVEEVIGEAEEEPDEDEDDENAMRRRRQEYERRQRWADDIR